MSTTPFDPDDPRLTAFALGEADEADRRAVEEMLAASAETRAEIERTQAFARLLAAEYARENEAYLAARPEGTARFNVVPFPRVERSHWQQRVASVLGVAAALALTASLVYLGVRRSHQPAAPVVASAPPNSPVVAPPPTSTASEPLAGNQQTADPTDGSRVGGMPSTEADPPRDTNLATTASGRTQTEFDRVARPSAAAPAPAGMPAPSMAQREAAAKSTGTASESARAAEAIVPDEPFARCTVRVRTFDGRFFDGVIVSTQGLILSYTLLADDAMRRPCTVTLADHREFSTVAEPALLGAGWYWLRIAADGLSIASPGTTRPANGTLLTTASLDARSGELTFSRLRAGASAAARVGRRQQPQLIDPNTMFAFNPGGELLLLEPPVQQIAPSGQDKVAGDRPYTKSISARPFTPAERKIIEQAIGSGEAPK